MVLCIDDHQSSVYIQVINMSGKYDPLHDGSSEPEFGCIFLCFLYLLDDTVGRDLVHFKLSLLLLSTQADSVLLTT
eukprot:g82285.t1